MLPNHHPNASPLHNNERFYSPNLRIGNLLLILSDRSSETNVEQKFPLVALGDRILRVLYRCVYFPTIKWYQTIKLQSTEFLATHSNPENISDENYFSSTSRNRILCSTQKS
ncbi:MAG: hypothetical protein F6K31_22635 [Symploca sp. SIO2G7]|nr:hypothetical protein [Symploca sp. SIO2G7]